MEVNTDDTAKAAPTVEDRFTVETNVVPEKAEPEKVEPSEDKTTEAETPESEPDEEPAKPINPRTAQRKAEKERLIRENAAMAERIRMLESQKPPSDEPKARDLSKEPDIKDYDDSFEYVRDLTRYDRMQEVSQATAQKQVEALAERAEAVRAEKPDFDVKVSPLLQSQLITPDIEKAILASDMGADVMYHLAEYGSDMMTLRGLPPAALPKAIKTIEAFIKQGGEQEKPRITKAEPPITPPGMTANADRPLSSYSQEELEEMPLTEYKRRFMK